MTPKAARTEKALIALRRDNVSTRNSWFLIDEGHVHIANQKTGESPTGKVTLTRAEFEAFVRFYETGRMR